MRITSQPLCSLMNYMIRILSYVVLITITVISSACAEDNKLLSKIINDNLDNKSTSEQRGQLHKIIRWPASCNETFTFPKAGFNFFKQSDTKLVLQVVCTYGAYQGMSLFYKLNLSSGTVHSHNLKLPKTYSDHTNESEIWGNVLTDSKVTAFRILNLYSGFGNCGRLTTYDLSNKQPAITQLKQQEDCDKTPVERDPEKWPVIRH